MATLNIEATPSEDLRRYELAIDQERVAMHANNKGTFSVAGDCGDGSGHTLGYVLVGPVGAKLTVKVLCGDAVEKEMDDITVRREPFAAGEVDFTL